MGHQQVDAGTPTVDPIDGPQRNDVNLGSLLNNGSPTTIRMRTATCRCWRLSTECAGEPVRLSVCHSLIVRNVAVAPSTLSRAGCKRASKSPARPRHGSASLTANTRDLSLPPEMRIDDCLCDRRAAGRDRYASRGLSRSSRGVYKSVAPTRHVIRTSR